MKGEVPVLHLKPPDRTYAWNLLVEFDDPINHCVFGAVGREPDARQKEDAASNEGRLTLKFSNEGLHIKR